jgi:hypothetical protein
MYETLAAIERQLKDVRPTSPPHPNPGAHTPGTPTPILALTSHERRVLASILQHLKGHP